ncbi:hypothetical protein TIFTF001_011300 [Ficus carica]|uniref:Pentatricopeptide repeat-containing protein n=1 Tax=Ficus carica TaxID=3494 RepID=A0AA87ZWY2_FICCA|nr:hypothetical protein TIFTF001_011300 [Ficus carica]
MEKASPSPFCVQKSRILSLLTSLFFTKPSVSAAKIDGDAPMAVHLPKDDAVSEILSGLNGLGLRSFLGGNYFRTIFSTLNKNQSILVSRFRDWDWDANAVEWDMLAFANSRHTDFVWDVYDAIRLNGIAQIGNPSSIVVDGSMEEALEFTDDMEKRGLEPNIVDTVLYNVMIDAYTKN